MKLCNGSVIVILGYIGDVMQVIMDAMDGNRVLPTPSAAPPSMTSQLETEPQAEVIARQRTRFTYM